MTDSTNADAAMLTPERIDRIRTSVMAEVRASTQPQPTPQRGLRRRVVAAAVVVLVAAIAVPRIVSSLSPRTPANSDSSVSSSVDASTEQADGTGQATGTEASPGSTESQALPQPQVVVTGSASVTVREPAAAGDKLNDWVTQHSGRVDARNDTTDEPSNTVMDVRVQPADVPALRDELDALGTVGAYVVNRQDESAQVADLDARAKALEISVARLRDIMSRATTAKDLLAAEKSLSDRQAELDSLTAQRNQLAGQIELANVEVTLIEKATTQPAPSGFVGGLSTGWHSLVASLGALVRLAGLVTPWLVPVGVIVLAWRRWFGSPKPLGNE